jgi:predicted glycosyltransferase
VISTAGYNAVVDLLSYGSKALIIPRVKFRQEQLIRAQILSGIGLFDYIHPDEVTPDKLYEEINRILNSSDKTLKSNRTNNSINLYGAENAAKIIGSLAYSTADLKGKS